MKGDIFLKDYRHHFNQDKELLLGLVEDKSESWRDFCKHKYVLGTVWGVLKKYQIPKSEFEDLFQDCVFKLSNAIRNNKSTLRNPENFISKAWAQIAEWTAKDYLRKIHKVNKDDLQDVETSDYTQEIQIENAEFKLFYHELFKPFTPDQIRLFEERHFNQKPFKEIAGIFSINEDAAKKRYSKLVVQLQKRYLLLKKLDN